MSVGFLRAADTSPMRKWVSVLVIVVSEMEAVFALPAVLVLLSPNPAISSASLKAARVVAGRNRIINIPSSAARSVAKHGRQKQLRSVTKLTHAMQGDHPN